MEVDQGAASIAWRVCLCVLGLLAVGCAGAYGLARRLTDPLEQLTETADRLAAGEPAELEPLSRDDEVGRLSRALSHMVAALREREDRLVQANVDLEYFSRIASHDLREPARRMALLANLLEEDAEPPLSEEGRDLSGRIQREALRLIDKLTDLRAFARLGQRELTRSEVDLGSLVAGVLADFRPELERRRVRVTVAALPTESVYPVLVELLYQNLVRNALAHVERDGFTLSFGSEPSPDGPVLGVHNSGSEIEGDVEALFEPQAASNGGRPGLGLSICRRIVERHSGKIWVESGPDGVRFRFTLSGGDHRA